MKITSETINEAMALLRQQEKALVSTHSQSKTGFPFGSVTTYMADHQGHPLIYISHLAQHTRNIKANPKISLLVSDDNDHDINAGARLTLLGMAEELNQQDVEQYAPLFFRRFPESKKYQSAHDFKFYRLQIKYIRYIGGFGQIFWLPTEQFLHQPASWQGHEQAAIEHMNDDHKDVLQLITKHQLGIDDSSLTMTHIFTDGFLLNTDSHGHQYIPFTEKIINATDIRQVLVKMTQAARAFVNEPVVL